MSEFFSLRWSSSGEQRGVSVEKCEGDHGPQEARNARGKETESHIQTQKRVLDEGITTYSAIYMSNDQSDQKTVSVRNRNSTVGYPAVAVRMIKVGHTN